MKATQAFSRLDRGCARIGNRWLERVWSQLLGTTVELRQGSDDTEWISGICPEFQLDLDDRDGIGAFELGEIEWSEERHPFGATLVCCKSCADVAFEVATTAFHDAPLLLRACRLSNRSPRTIQLLAVTCDSLRLLREDVHVYVDGFSRCETATAWRSAENTVALLGRKKGLFLGIDGGGSYDLFYPVADVCALRIETRRTVSPGGRAELPHSFIVAFEGGLDQAVSGVLAASLQAIENYVEWQAKRRRATEEDE